MIVLKDVSKSVGSKKKRLLLFQHLSAAFDPQTRYVLFFERRTGKTTFLNLLLGTESPNRGSVQRNCVVAPAAGFGLSYFPGNTPVGQAIGLLAQLYGASPGSVLRAVQAFIKEPLLANNRMIDLGPEVRTRTAYALSYCLPADVYLFEHSPMTGRGDFQQTCMAAFRHRTSQSGSILATSITRGAEAFGEVGGIFADGKLTFYASVAEAAERFGDIQNEHVDLNVKVDRLLRAGRTAQALSLFAPDRPLSAEEFSKLMQILLKQRAYDEIIERCEAQIDGDNELAPEAFFYLVAVAAEEGRHDDVVRLAEELDRIGYGYDRIAFVAGRSFEVLGMFEPAATAYLRISETPSGSDLRAAIRCLIRAGCWDKAKELLYSDGIKVDAGILERRTQVLYHLGSEDAYQASIVALADVNALRAWSAAIAARRRLSGHKLVNLIRQLPSELPSLSSPNEMKALRFFLEREVKTASTLEAQEISEFLANLPGARDNSSQNYVDPI